MIPTHLNKSSKPHISGTLVAVLLVIMLAACGTNPVTTASPAGAHPSSTANRLIKTPTAISTVPPISLNINVSQINVDKGDLRIQSDTGFQCPYNPLGIPMDQLVLASDRMTYSQNEINQMGDYVGTNFNWSAAKLLRGGTEPPATLRWVLGGSMDPIPGTLDTAPVVLNDYFACGATLTLTNIGSTLIQIPQVGVQLEGRPQQNTYQYRLIDACSVTPQSQVAQDGCTPSQGNNPGCGTYAASIQLGLGEKNDIFSTVPSAQGCGTLTIAPSAQTFLIFYFSLASNIPRNLIYSIAPILTVNTAQGEQTLSISQLVSTLAFASVNQFSCYGLKGTTFVLEQSPIFSQNLWCM